MVVPLLSRSQVDRLRVSRGAEHGVVGGGFSGGVAGGVLFGSDVGWGDHVGGVVGDGVFGCELLVGVDNWVVVFDYVYCCDWLFFGVVDFVLNLDRLTDVGGLPGAGAVGLYYEGDLRLHDAAVGVVYVVGDDL